jgi:Fur family transcriptional regulator, ferric uptake regulator
MEKHMPQISDTIKKNNLKVTANRIRILEFLRESKTPLSAENIYLKLRDNGIAINLSTIYRTLEIFTLNNLVISLNVEGDKKVLYECVGEHHHHYLICLSCSKIISLDYCPLESYEKELEKQLDYTLISHRLVLYGHCPKCKSKQHNLTK